MSRHKSKPKHGDAHRNHSATKQRGTAKPRAIHTDWRTYAVVGLMLAAMVGYILSLDEAIEPDGEVGPAVPAAVAE